MAWLLVVGVQVQGREAARAATLIPDFSLLACT